MTGDRITAVAEREFRTVLRTPALLALSLGFVALVGGLAWTAGARGYVTLALDLLAPLEALVAVLGIALGYRTVVADATRGELDVIRTFPVSPRAYVLGVFLGRGVVLVGTVIAALAVAALAVALTGTEIPSVLAASATADSPLLYVRFVVLVALYAPAPLAIAIAASAVVRTTRAAVGTAVAGLLVVVLGLDLALIGVAAGNLVGDSLGVLVVLSPASAFRGLVLETVVEAVAPGRFGVGISPLRSLLGLVLWTAIGLAVAELGVRAGGGWGGGVDREPAPEVPPDE